MIAYADYSTLLEMPAPRLITTEAQWLNMKTDDIQIELAPTCGERIVRVNGVLVPVSQKQLARFNEQIDRSGGENACWLWMGCRNRDGYGNYEVKNKYIGSHRMAFQLKHGPIPKAISVLHNCPSGDNPACCNPAHLWLGTQRQNILDMEKKGRARHPSGSDHGFRKHPESVMRGEKSVNAKMTDAKVKQARQMADSGRYDNKEIGKMFGVTQQCIYLIVKRKSWKHVS